MDNTGKEITGESIKMIECPSCDFENADQAPACQKCDGPLFGRDPVCAMPTFGGDSTSQVLDRRYVITRQIGPDDAGVLHQAEDAENNTPVLIRALPKIIADDPARIDDIRKKAKNLLDLSHANIVPLLGFQLDGPVKYFVSQYLPGPTLAQRLSSAGPLTQAQAAAAFEPLGEALDYAHSQNHLHGDINPANIILTPDGSPKLANFEITRWIKDSLSRANADQADDASLYFAPEQFRTGKSRQRSDIYSFAATMYQSLCRPPLIWRGWIEYQVLNESPAPLNELTDEQNAALLKALSRDSRYRYRSTYKFLADLNLNSRPFSTAAPPKKDTGPVSLTEQAINKMNAGIESELQAETEAKLKEETEARLRAEEKARAEAEKLAAETRAKEKAEKRAGEEARARVIAEEKTHIEAKKLAELETQNRRRTQAQAEERKQALEKERIEAEKTVCLEVEIKKKAQVEAKKAVKTQTKAKAKARKHAYKQAIAKAEKKARNEAAARAETEKKLAEQIKARSAIEKQAKEYARELVLAQTAEPSDEIAIDLDAQQIAQTDITAQTQPDKPTPKSARLVRVLAAAAILVIAILAAALYYTNYVADPPRAAEALAKAQMAASRLNYQQALRTADAIIAEFPKYAEKHSIPQIKNAWQEALTNAGALQIWQKIQQLTAQSEYDKAITAAARLLNEYPNTPYAAKAIIALPVWRSILDANRQVADFLAKAKTAQDANDLDAALAAATSALDLDPDNADAAVLKAKAQAAKQAQLRLRQIAAQKQKQLDTLINQALSYQNAKDFERAIDIYIKASVLMPDDRRIIDGLAFCTYSVHLSNARAAQSTGDFDSAMESYTNALPFANTPELKNSLESTIATLKARRKAEETKRLARQWLSKAGQAEAAGDLDTAVEWYQRAADANDPTAMHKLALAYYNGNGVDQNIVDTVEWFEKAADAGNSDSMLRLGLIYHAGDGIEKNLAKAFDCYHKAAKAANPEAMHNLGAMYYAGEGTDKDVPEAVKWLEKAAAAGNVQAMYNIAVAYYNGDGIEKDYAKAIEWFRKAADANDLPAMYNLALAYLDIADYTNAKKWFAKAADTGNIEAMYNLGVMYYNGYGVNRDFARAGEWYSKAAQAGETNAMVNLGLMHDEGIGTPKDPDKAVQWYRKAADAENPRAMSNLAMAYYQGNGLEKNQQKALEWLKKAADLGEPMAMFNLALMHQQGQTVQKDLAKAADWYKKAADLGHPQAKEELNKLNKTE